MARAGIGITGVLIGAAGFIGGYFFGLPYTSYVVGVGLLLLIIGIFMPSPK